MQDNPNTDEQRDDLLVDRDDWEIAFTPFEEKPYAALRLGWNLATLRTDLEGQLFKPQSVVEALDLAMEVLFPYTSFHRASFDLFIRLVENKLTFEEEQMLNALGVKF